MLAGDQQALQALAVQGVTELGEMRGRPAGMASWSSYNTLQQLNADTLVLRLARALMAATTTGHPVRRTSRCSPHVIVLMTFDAGVESEVRRAQDLTAHVQGGEAAAALTRRSFKIVTHFAPKATFAALQ